MLKARMGFRSQLKLFYQLSKPGIIRGNLLTAAAGYVFAAGTAVDGQQLGYLLAGIALTIAGACAANNILDRGIDARMQRTRQRALVSGQLSLRQSIVFSVLVTSIGLVLVGLTQNRLTALLIAFAWFAYVVLYGYAKRVTVHGTLVGCISGSIPLVAGYSAVTGQFDVVALQLALLMTTWQMGHFFGIALYRQTDYAAANIPVMSVVRGARYTQLQTVGYIVLFCLVAAWMFATRTLSLITASFLIGLGLAWLLRAYQLRHLEPVVWGRSVFLFSLIVMLGMSFSFVANPLLPL